MPFRERMNHDPYIPPTAPGSPTPTSNSGKTLALTGALLQLGPLVGTVMTVIGMVQAFRTMESAQSGIGDPARLSAAIGHVLYGVFAGLVRGLVGLVLLFVALLGSRYRAEWFFWFLCIYGGLLTLSFPFGTAFGIFFLVYCITRRGEFLRPADGVG